MALQREQQPVPQSTPGTARRRHAAAKHSSPIRLSGAEWKQSLKGAKAHSKKDRLNIVAGSLAYRWFLSLFPLLISLLGIAALVRLSPSVTHKLITGAGAALPSGAASVLTSALSHAVTRTSGALGATVIAAVVALWSGSSSMAVLQSGLDMAYEIPEDRKFVAKRAVALLMLGFAVLLGGAATALIVFGAQLGSLIDGHVPVAGTAFLAIWTVVRWVAALLLVMSLFAVLYWLGPKRTSPRWQWLSPGALVGTIAWVLVSLAFSYYTSSFGSYSKTYGAFAGVAILIFWFYLTGAIVLFGAEINAELERRHSPDGAMQNRQAVSRAA